mgnify:FL=1
MALELQTDIRYLKGVGESRAALYQKLGIETVEDLLYHIPRRYIDLTRPTPLAAAVPGQKCAVRALLTAKGREQRIRRGLSVFRLTAVDGPVTLHITFFNAKYTVEALREGEEYIFYGTVTGGFYSRQMDSPQVFRPEEAGTLLPVYSLTQGLSNKMVSRQVTEALNRVEQLPDPLEGSGLPQQYGLLPYSQALHAVHFPPDWQAIETGRNRMVFDELLCLSLCFARMREGRHRLHIPPMQMQPLTEYYRALPYELTGAQQRAIAEAMSDMCSGTPMNRLVQGDVGSGKTAVAAALCYFAHRNGAQSTLMAPTEILAQQHYNSLAPLLGSLGMQVALLTGSLSPKKKEALKAALAAGEIDLCIGTHALLTDDTAFANLGLVVTDEQHRFGVQQRAALRQKGKDAHVLVMSATPIPRTLAMIVYGDLEISVIDELPAGRRPIRTYLIDSTIRQRAFGYIKKHLDEGYQAYLVCPAVQSEDEDTAAASLKSAVEYAEELAHGAFGDYRVGLLHGKMRPAQKEKVMAEFAAGEIQLLVATTVVEVGVDVPNAVIMMVENAERFGLSQLHQLRGRVGRGQVQSHCILLSDTENPDTLERLRVLCGTNDGFKIAEEDLKQRGPGDFFGERQHGLPEMKIADLAADSRLLQKAREAADALTERDPTLHTLPALARRVERLMAKMSL